MKYIFFTLAIFFSTFCFSADLPAAPNGFKWQKSKIGIGIFLIPDGWHFKEESEKSNNALFITKEKIENNKPFTTGMTVNQINNFTMQTQTLPSEYAKQYIQSVINKHSKVIKSFSIPNPAGEMYGAQVIGMNKDIPTVLHFLVQGNDDKNKLYILIFESPESLWSINSQIATPMLNMFGLGE